jgi:N-acetylneuraminate synthase
MSTRCLIIAEAGVNHNGHIDIALDLVDRAADAGADVVKFQTFRSSELASGSAPKAGYQQRSTQASESQLDMLRRLELSQSSHHAILKRCEERGIGFLSTPFDLPSLDFLTKDLRQTRVKLGSGELTNGPLLLAAARSGASIILSTGMSNLSEVEEALGVLGYGITGGLAPCRAAFANVLHDAATWEVLRERVTLLHCTTEYPAPVEEINLRVLATLRHAFGLSVGYSDHTLGNTVSFAAVALGATVIEKHFTIDRSLPGPDHAASLEPGELIDLVRGIRSIEQALGTGIKQPGRAELQNLVVARKSLTAARNLPAGHVLTEADICTKRPGAGISAMDFWDAQGQTVAETVAEGGYIRLRPGVRARGSHG